jgi:hypothetical protein
MSDNIVTAVKCLKIQAEIIERKLEDLHPEDNVGCVSCGFLTQANIDADQEVRVLIVELSEISESLTYLEGLL